MTRIQTCPRPSRPRALVASGAVLAALALLVPAQTGLAAVPAGGPVGGGPVGGGPAGASPPPAADGPAAHRVLLVTGDVLVVEGVTVPAAADAPAPVVDRTAVSVLPAPGREDVAFLTFSERGRLQVVPEDAVPLLAAGVLDEDLFDVTGLVEGGYGEDELPLIVEAPSDLGRTARPDGLEDLRALGGSGFVAGDLTEETAEDFWAGLSDGAGAPGSAARAVPAPARVHLDGRVEVTLDRSVPQVGAPEVWSTGTTGTGVEVAVLDTGVDLDHPHLQDAVTLSADFTGSGSVADAHGHGTHVAATVAGRGPARGVAPGADLLVGRVLGDDGSGSESGVIEGMEWAVAQGADVVNMSLGGAPSDGTDPLSLTLERLSATSDTLFVVAAGNEGAAYTVGSPGAATSALTVGAVDRDDVLADFSSRGPRVGDQALVPDLVAPGVGIVAARATGTAMGEPVDDLLTAASGTSMATPHVAGAAALLAQRHPDWDGERLLDALVSTTVPLDASAYDVGSGRLDVARTAASPVHATGTLDLGTHPSEDAARQEGVLTLRASGPDDVAVTLVGGLTDVAGRPAPDGALTLPDAVVVPGGGSVEVPVAVDVAALPDGRWAGQVEVRDGGLVLARTTLGVRRTPPTAELTVEALDLAGRTTNASVVALISDTDPTADVIGYLGGGGPQTWTVPQGRYSLHALGDDLEGGHETAVLHTVPELVVDGDADITLDARATVPLELQTPEPAMPDQTWGFHTWRDVGTRAYSHGVMKFSTTTRLRVTPTPEQVTGDFELTVRMSLRQAQLGVVPVRRTDPAPQVYALNRSPLQAGRDRLRLADVGSADPVADRAAIRAAAGALAVVRPGPGEWPDEDEVVTRLAEAGVAAVLLAAPDGGSPWTVWRPDAPRLPVPAGRVSRADADRLLAQAPTPGRALVTLVQQPVSPFLYEVSAVWDGHVPDRLVHVVDPRRDAVVDAAYHAMAEPQWAVEQRFAFRPWQEFSITDSQRPVRTGTRRTEVLTGGDTGWFQRVQHRTQWNTSGPLVGGADEPLWTATPGLRTSRDWFGGVVAPAVPAGAPGPARVPAGLRLGLVDLVDEAGHGARAGTSGEDDVIAVEVRAGGETVWSGQAAPDGVLALPAGGHEVEVAMTTARRSDAWARSTATATRWRTTVPAASGEAVPVGLLQVGWRTDVGGRLDGTVPAGDDVGLLVTVVDPRADGAGPRPVVEWSQGDGWAEVPTRATGDGWATDLTPVGDAPVSLRVSAVAADGSTVVQEVTDAVLVAPDGAR